MSSRSQKTGRRQERGAEGGSPSFVPASLRRRVIGLAAAVLVYSTLPGAAFASLAMDNPQRLRVAAETFSTLMRPGGAVDLLAVPATDHPLSRLRELYYAAVQDRAAIDMAMEEVEALREAGRARTGSRRAAVLDGYVGALTTLRAKHGRWPPNRLRNLNDGLDILDQAVADAPDVVEIRYLRLMSCYYLPGILGRGGTVQEDFEALTRLLPDASAEFPPRLYRTIISFVVEHAELDHSDRAALEAAARQSHLDSE